MKNCELFGTEEALKRAWERRKELTGVTDDSGFMKWACFADPDYALLPKYAPGRLLMLNGRYIIVKSPHSNKEGPDRVFNQIIYVESNGHVSNNWVIDDRFKEADIPQDILDIARAQIIEEMRNMCPVMSGKMKKKENEDE